MKRVSKAFTAPVILLLAMFFTRSFLPEQKCIAKPLKIEVVQKIKRLQIPFVVNKGQINETIKFYATTFGGTVFITKEGEIVYSLPVFKRKKDAYLRDVKNLKNSTNQICSNTLKYSAQTVNTDAKDLQCLVVKEEIFDGKVLQAEGEEKTITSVNYFKGNDPSLWKEHITTYGCINLGEVYNGIELKLRTCGDTVEKFFYVKPNADPDSIKIKLSGANALRVNEQGQLEAETDLGVVTFTKPAAYQEIYGKKVEVAVEYHIQKSEYRGKNTDFLTVNPKPETRNLQLVYGLKVANYDRTKELVIDPLLAATYLGGDSRDVAYSMAINSDGDIYVGGWTKSPDFPTSTDVYGTSHHGDYDAFIAKMDADLTKIIACTYLGGSSNDYLHSIAIDSYGEVCVTGLTASSNFPTSTDAFDTSYNGDNSDIFISKLRGNLTKLNASTYMGGSSDDTGESIVVDREGNIFVTGETYSSNFPVIKGSYDTSYGGYYDIFISKLNRNLTKLLASTYLGGKDYDYSFSMAMDSDENLYITGNTWSSNFPTTANAYDTSQNGVSDAFVSKFNASLKNLLASTYLGGNDYDYGQSIAIDANVNIVVVGQTHSSNFPTTYGAFKTTHGGYYDVFISSFPSDLTSLLGATYLGGSGYDYGESIAIDLSGSLRRGTIYVSGYTTSPNFPTTTGAYDTALSGYTDVFVSKISSDLRSLLASTYLGGTLRDYGYGHSMVIDATGNIYTSGWTESPNFPVTSNAYDTAYGNDYDIFVAKLDNNLSTPFIAPGAVTGSATNVTAYSATLNGTVNAEGSETVVWFEYSTERGAYNKTSSKQTITGSGDTPVSIDIRELTGALIYHYRIVAQNEAGITYGMQSSFTPCTDPYEPNESIDRAYGPILSGSSYHGRICNSSDVDFFKIELASPGRISTTLDVPRNKDYDLRLYDPSRSLIISTFYVKDVDHIDYNAAIKGTYYIEVLSHAGDYDEILTYSLLGTWPTTTAALPPIVATGTVTNIAANSATLNGIANANLSSTTAWFEYGTTRGSYSGISPTRIIEGAADTAVSIDVKELSPGTTYYYRIGAKNDVGIVYGSEGVFATP